MPAAAAPRHALASPHWTLAAACFSQFMIQLDVTIVNVTLPSIQRALDADAGRLVWIIDAYVLPLAALILLGGTLGDLLGRKRVFLLGYVAFTVTSVGCALAATDVQLIAFRALQGIGAALLAPSSLSILTHAYQPVRRPWAIGMWATISGLGFGMGPVLAGVLVDAWGWAAIFWVNVPIGVAGAVVTALAVRESSNPHARRLDGTGAALISCALFCLAFGLVQTHHHAWSSWQVAGMLVAALVLGSAFVALERRHPDPMLPLGFFANRAFRVANLDFLLAYAALAATLFFVSLYFQNVLRFSPLETGIAWLSMNVPFLSVASWAGRLQGRFGPRRVAVAGLAAGGSGIALFAILVSSTRFGQKMRRI